MPGACTLPTVEQPLRAAEFESLFADAVRGVERPEPTLLRLVLDGADEVEAAVRDLAARESACCSFFAFGLGRGADGLTLDIRVPAAQVAVLDGLAALATPAAGSVVGRR